MKRVKAFTLIGREISDSIIIIFFNCNWVITPWQWLLYTYTNMEKKVTRESKLGGLREKHVVADTALCLSTLIAREISENITLILLGV